jgi:hypothetical protein
VLEPGEKTGAELLQQILKERQDRENKENGKKAKKLTLSTIEEEPWELPEGWCWCRVADLCELSDAKKGKVGPNKGKTFSAEHRQRLSEAHRKKEVLNV